MIAASLESLMLTVVTCGMLNTSELIIFDKQTNHCLGNNINSTLSHNSSEQNDDSNTINVVVQKRWRKSQQFLEEFWTE
jgi:hypothetical protein